MEQEKTNIAALLKDAPKGTKLYSPICGECEFDYVTSSNRSIGIHAKRTNDLPLVFDKHGCFTTEEDVEGNRYANPNGECLLFPSKEVRDWGCFRAKYVVVYIGTTPEGRQAAFELLKKEGGNGIIACLENGHVWYIDRCDNNIKYREVDSDEGAYILDTGMEQKQMKFKKGDEVVILNERQTGSTPMTHIVDEEIDDIVYMDNYSYGMFVGGVALAKAKEEPETRMRYKDFTDYLRRFTANNFGLFVGDKPLTEEMIEVDLEHNKLTINV